MAQRIIGLDVGTWSVKALVLESSIRRSHVAAFREHHLPADTKGQPIAGELEAGVRATLAGLDPDAVVAGIAGSNLLTRELTLPFADDKRIEKILGFQLESVLPKQLHEVVYDYELIREVEDGADLLCAAVDTTRLEEWLSQLKAAGADPRIVSTTALTSGFALAHLGADDTDRRVALVDLGHKTTDVTVVENGRVVAIRTLNRGGYQLTRALMRGLKVEWGEAEHIKHTGVRFDGYLPEGVDEVTHGQRAKLVAQALEPLLREVRVTLHAAADRLRAPIDEVVLFGGTAKLPGIGALTSRVVDLPAAAPTPTGPLWDGGVAAEEVVTSGLSAMGLALRSVADNSSHRVNFRQGDLAYESDFRAYRDKFVWLGIFAAVLLTVFFVRKVMHVSRLEAQEAALVAQLDTFTEDLFGAPYEGDDPLAKFTAARADVMVPPDTSDGLFPKMTAFKIFFDASEILQGVNADAPEVEADKDADKDTDGEAESDDAPAEPARKQLELTAFTADVKALTSDFQTATLTGHGYDITAIGALEAALETHRCFQKVERQGDTKPVRFGKRQGWREFTLKIEVKCPSKDGEPEPVADASDKKEDR